MIDIRVPIGLMFAIIGALMTVHGVSADISIYERSFGINLNLGWGAAQIVFGALMLFLGRRRKPPAARTPEGDAIERLERRRGLEH